MTALFESVSTWDAASRCPRPLRRAAGTSWRTFAREGDMLSSGWLRVAVDGLSGAGKTHTYNNETCRDGRAAPTQRETLVAAHRWAGSESCRRSGRPGRSCSSPVIPRAARPRQQRCRPVAAPPAALNVSTRTDKNRRYAAQRVIEPSRDLEALEARG